MLIQLELVWIVLGVHISVRQWRRSSFCLTLSDITLSRFHSLALIDCYNYFSFTFFNQPLSLFFSSCFSHFIPKSTFSLTLSFQLFMWAFTFPPDYSSLNLLFWFFFVYRTKMYKPISSLLTTKKEIPNINRPFQMSNP